MLRLLPDDQETTPRLLSVDPRVRAVCLESREAALEWALAQGWTCGNGKAITRTRWIAEIPGHKEAVSLAAQEEPEYYKDVYSMLSGATHSQPLLMALSISDEPDRFLDRALLALDIGITYYTSALERFTKFMGWHDHDVEAWFGPVHATLDHIRFPEEFPLPLRSINLDQCEVCPDYQAPFMHRLALVSHLCALLERNVDRSNAQGTDAPTRYSWAVEFFDKYQQALTDGSIGDTETKRMRAAVGNDHATSLFLLGSDPAEVLTTIAASWSVMRSSSYESSIGNIQCWVSPSDDESATIPCGAE